MDFLDELEIQVLTDARPTLLGSLGSGYPLHMLKDDEIPRTVALMLMDQSRTAQCAEELRECWLS